MNQFSNDQIIRFPKVHELTGLSRSTIDRLEKAGKFPNRFNLSINAVGWKLSDVDQWINERPVCNG